jgi:hypothetical protein
MREAWMFGAFSSAFLIETGNENMLDLGTLLAQCPPAQI